MFGFCIATLHTFLIISVVTPAATCAFPNLSRYWIELLMRMKYEGDKIVFISLLTIVLRMAKTSSA
jgi:hypothetical protein